jgi:thiol-disulfide isomerase/thioredoxin
VLRQGIAASRRMPRLAMSGVKEISQADYEALVVGAEGPVLLDFFSTECPPCEALGPKYEALAEQYGGRVQFLKIFRQGNRDLATRLGVTGRPTVLFYRGGAETGERLTGDIKRSELKQRVEELLG